MLHWTEIEKVPSKSQKDLADGAKEGKEEEIKRVRSKSQKELAEGAEKGVVEDIKNLEYFTAQLQLFCNMCFNRQYLAILKIKEQLPIDIVLQ